MPDMPGGRNATVLRSVPSLNTASPQSRGRRSGASRSRWSFRAVIRCTFRRLKLPLTKAASSTGTALRKSPWCASRSGVYHEHPPQRRAALIRLIALTRGSPIETLGAADLLVRDAHGAHLRILQADQTVYLRPRATRPWGPAIEVGSDALPDVVLEVDNTTDVRRGKLALYESWGFPEVWVEVPDTPSPSRPAALRPGLTIHVLGERGFGTEPASRAFTGWTAQEIHRALNEAEVSAATTAALRRVGRALGATEGTEPDDDPFLRAERLEVVVPTASSNDHKILHCALCSNEPMPTGKPEGAPPCSASSPGCHRTRLRSTPRGRRRIQ